MFGIVSAFTVPLFLQMVSSNLLHEAKTDNLKYLVFVGFCLVAAFFSSRFLQSVADKVIQDLEDVKNKTKVIQKETIENKEKVDELIDEKTDNGEFTNEKLSLDNLKIDTDNHEFSALYTSLIDDKYKFRTMGGLYKDTGIDKPQLEELVITLEENKLVKKFKGKEGKDIYSITQRGRHLFKNRN